MKDVLHLTETSDTGGAEYMFISLVKKLDKYHYKSIACLLGDGWLKARLQRRGSNPKKVFMVRSPQLMRRPEFATISVCDQKRKGLFCSIL